MHEPASTERGLAWWPYRLVRGFLRSAMAIFFRHIEVVGLENVPGPGVPVIFCGNHPNSLLDPGLITTTCGRVVHFAAKDVLFRSRPLRFFLTPLGAVPIMRRRDHAEGPLDNTSTFDRLYQVLAAGRCMGIFPEGISHDESQLARLKTGAARIALGAAERHGLAVRLIPVGLTYLTRDRFRSSILVQFGEPTLVDASWVARAGEHERDAVRDLTAIIERGLRALTVNASDWETLRVLDGVRRLYQPQGIELEQRVELMRRFNATYPQVADAPDVRDLFRRVQQYLGRLQALGLRDQDLQRRPSRGETFVRVARHLTTLLVWLPLSLFCAFLFLPVGAMVRYGSAAITPRKDVLATTKLLTGMFMMLGLYLITAIAAGWWGGWGAALAVVGLLPISAFATLRVLERFYAIRHGLLTLYRLLTLRTVIVALRAEREELEAAVIAAVGAHLPAGMEPLFNRERPARPQ